MVFYVRISNYCQVIRGQVGDEGGLASSVDISVIDLLYFFILHLKSSLSAKHPSGAQQMSVAMVFHQKRLH